MKKLFVFFISFIFVQNLIFAKDILEFDFPNKGWHKVESPDGIKSKKCYVPENQTKENYNEMIIFMERILKNTDLNAMYILQKQLGKDKNNYKDIQPEYILKEENNAIVAWCSQFRNTCAVERVFQGRMGVISVIYINKMPHYSQNIFGQWSNILALVKIYDEKSGNTKNLIELD